MEINYDYSGCSWTIHNTRALQNDVLSKIYKESTFYLSIIIIIVYSFILNLFIL